MSFPIKEPRQDCSGVFLPIKTSRPVRVFVNCVAACCLVLYLVAFIVYLSEKSGVARGSPVEQMLSPILNCVWGKLAPYAELWDRSALAAVSQLLALTGTAFTWLVSATDIKVHGVAIGELSDWAYPKIYRYFFLFFLSSVIISVYSGSVAISNQSQIPPSLQAASAFSSSAALIMTVYLMWVCYKLLMDRNSRIRMIYSYYYCKMENSLKQFQQELPDNSPNREKIMAETASYWIERAAESVSDQVVTECNTGYSALGKMCSYTAALLTEESVKITDGNCSQEELLRYHEQLHNAYLKPPSSTLSGGYLESIKIEEQLCSCLRQDIKQDTHWPIALSRLLNSLDRNSDNDLRKALLLAGLIRGVIQSYRGDLKQAAGCMLQILESIDRQRSIFQDPDQIKKRLIWGFGMHLTLCDAPLRQPEQVGGTDEAVDLFLPHFQSCFLNSPDPSGLQNSGAVQPPSALPYLINLGQRLTKLQNMIAAAVNDQKKSVEQAETQCWISDLYGAGSDEGLELLLLYIEWAFRAEYGVTIDKYLQYVKRLSPYTVESTPEIMRLKTILYYTCRRELVIEWFCNQENMRRKE